MTTIKVIPGAPFSLGFGLKAVDGLKSVSLVGKDGAVATEDLTAAGRETLVAFAVSTPASTWSALNVEDLACHHAYTKPVWLDAAPYPPSATGAGGALRP